MYMINDIIDDPEWTEKVGRIGEWVGHHFVSTEVGVIPASIQTLKSVWEWVNVVSLFIGGGRT
jgi:hypothetical protein